MAKKASDRVRYYENQGGSTIGTVSRTIIQQDGLYFKDLDGSGEYKPFDDWRLPAEERAQAYVNVLTVKEGRENDEAILALAKALQSEEVRSFIDEKYSGGVVALF